MNKSGLEKKTKKNRENLLMFFDIFLNTKLKFLFEKTAEKTRKNREIMLTFFDDFFCVCVHIPMY